jgi:hypothetical protein
MNTWLRFSTVAALLVAAACEDGTGPNEFTTEDLIAELAITPDHVHAFETTVTFTVAVEDPDGNPVTDFDVLQVERRLEGAANFSVMETTLAGDFYSVEYTFERSGLNDIRVTGMRPGDASLVVLHEEPNQLEVVRPHGHAGGRNVELEPNPGHIHEGDTSDVQFWILDATTDAGITGLTPTIFIDHAVAGHTEMAAAEGTGGLYHASHVFAEPGETTLGIRFTGTDGNQHEWSLPIEVHHAH